MVAYLVHGIPIENVGIWELDKRLGEWAGDLYPKGSVDPRLHLIVTLVAPATDEKRFGTDFRIGDKEDLDMGARSRKTCAHLRRLILLWMKCSKRHNGL